MPRKKISASKENVAPAISKSKTHSQTNDKKTFIKPVRKPLGDKTNSASDDNISTDSPKDLKKPTPVVSDVKCLVRPRRERRLPSKFDKSNVLSSLPLQNQPNVAVKSVPGSNKVSCKESYVPSVKTPQKRPLSVAEKSATPVEAEPVFKTPVKAADSSIEVSRPKRVHRLPSRFEDHSISPHKFIPVQPCFSSTPLVKKNNQRTSLVTVSTPPTSASKPSRTQESINNATPEKRVLRQRTLPNMLSNTSADTTKNKSLLEQKKKVQSQTKVNKSLTKSKKANKENYHKVETNKKSPLKRVAKQNKVLTVQNEKITPLVKKQTRASKRINNNHTEHDIAKRLINKDYSFKVLEDLNESQKTDAVYEFTFDPNEEPTRQKKKRTQTVKRKARVKPKPKAKVAFNNNNNYEKNVSQVIQTLKAAVNKNDVKNTSNKSKESRAIIGNGAPDITPTEVNTNISTIEETNRDEIPCEPILDYSPAAIAPQSPAGKMSCINETRDQLRFTRARSLFRPEANQKDPLNLLEEISFEDTPVASSSMNVSVRHPEASPWRAEFNNLPIKWQVNSYTKTNMTPAVEHSYVNFNDSKKKHVYTDLVPEVNETLPDIVTENDGVKLKQTTLIDFIRDAAEKSVRKKKRVVKETDVPSRAYLPKTVLTFGPSSEVVNKMYNEMKTASDAPVVQEPPNDAETNVDEYGSMMDNDSQSVHLFEDVDIVHHTKPSRKSYSRTKKVTFLNASANSIFPTEDQPLELDDNDDEDSDATFELPNVKSRKAAKKKKAAKVSKKEAEEVEAWAAAFNSMCEDVDEFDLVVE